MKQSNTLTANQCMKLIETLWGNLLTSGEAAVIRAATPKLSYRSSVQSVLKHVPDGLTTTRRSTITTIQRVLIVHALVNIQPQVVDLI